MVNFLRNQKFNLSGFSPLSLKVDLLNISTANKHSFSRFIVLIIFKDKKTGKWINFTDEKGWVLSDTLDKDRVPDNIYKLVNEIMEDLKCSFEDIDIIELFHKRCRHFYRTLAFKSQLGCLIIRDWETKEWKRCRY